MKKFIIFTTSLLLGFSSLFAQAKQESFKVLALVVGVSDYADDGIPDLKFARNDAVAFAEFLKSPNGGSVPEDNVVLLTDGDATTQEIMDQISKMSARASAEDVLIFFFSGHGKGDKYMDTKAYFLTHNTVNGKESGSAISMGALSEVMYSSRAKMKISYVDACHAGMFKVEGAKGVDGGNKAIVNAYAEMVKNAKSGAVAFLASQAGEQSMEKPELNHGVFTYYLLHGLNGEADQELKGSPDFGNKVVTIKELQQYLVNKVGKATNYEQRPSFVELKYDPSFPLSVVTGLKLPPPRTDGASTSGKGSMSASGSSGVNASSSVKKFEVAMNRMVTIDGLNTVAVSSYDEEKGKVITKVNGYTRDFEIGEITNAKGPNNTVLKIIYAGKKDGKHAFVMYDPKYESKQKMSPGTTSIFVKPDQPALYAIDANNYFSVRKARTLKGELQGFVNGYNRIFAVGANFNLEREDRGRMTLSYAGDSNGMHEFVVVRK